MLLIFHVNTLDQSIFFGIGSNLKIRERIEWKKIVANWTRSFCVLGNTRCDMDWCSCCCGLAFFKFTDYEAKGIMGLVAHSPFMSWALALLGLHTLSAALGVTEIVVGLLIATPAFAPKVSAVGSGLAVIMFLITLSFLFTTPGVIQMGHSFPFLSPMPGQFLLKDILLLGTAIWTAGEAWRAGRLAQSQPRVSE